MYHGVLQSGLDLRGNGQGWLNGILRAGGLGSREFHHSLFGLQGM